MPEQNLVGIGVLFTLLNKMNFHYIDEKKNFILPMKTFAI